MNPYRRTAAIGLSAIVLIILALFAIVMGMRPHSVPRAPSTGFATQPKGQQAVIRFARSVTIDLASNSSGLKPGRKVTFYLSVHPIGFRAHQSNDGQVAFKGKELIPVVGKVESQLPSGNAYRYKVVIPSIILRQHPKRLFVAASYALFQVKNEAPAGIYSTSLETIAP